MSAGLLPRLRDELRNRRAGQLNNALASTGDNARARYTAARSGSATGGMRSGPDALSVSSLFHEPPPSPHAYKLRAAGATSALSFSPSTTTR